MINKDRISCIPKSSLCDSLSTQHTTDNSILTSTRNQEENLKFSISNSRRRAILPTPNRPKHLQHFLTMSNQKEINTHEQIVISKDILSQSRDKNPSQMDVDNTDNNSPTKISDNLTDMIPNLQMENSFLDNTNQQNRVFKDKDTIDDSKNDESYKRINTSARLIKHSEEAPEVSAQSQPERDTNDDNFDAFILQNFVPFSGKQNVVQWLDETENKFNQLRIGRNFRFEAISLLVEGYARRKYIKNRKEIRSFDDFYEFLLSEFEPSDSALYESKSHQTITNKSCDSTATYQTNFANESNQIVSNNSNTIKSTAMVNLGTTNNIGERPVINSTIVSDSFSTSISDQTQNDLRKAIVGNLIKNPKTFKGGKDDVKKWIEEIEHLLDVAHIPDATRLNLISYSLRGDALEWFKNNRLLFSSWNIFVSELIRAFTSSFHEELAFKKLESYSQGEHQSIRSFFNEVLKLCKDADSTMSEATKLKNLLNKTKPSIQFEVRKKKPTSTVEFLEHAKEAEELMQLSNLTTDNTNINNNNQLVQQQSIPSLISTPIPPINQSFGKTSNNFSPHYSRNFDNNYQAPNNRNIYSNPNSSSFLYSQLSQSKARPANNFSRYPQQETSFNSTNHTRKPYQQSRPNYSSNTYSRERTANTISLPQTTTTATSLNESYPSAICSQCNQFGHEAAACSNF
ncbi:unnamed protein product [Rotaria magnacalcarata]|uniref:Ty3 transposon capsid-like protein domain-containing protein n=1 Tax=Rotaria magnacalcarata TaxID=392030 RepID=A0A816TZL3_9BILA|nr:unnamed protein product [Rotaria magnacalcarata]CAF3939889.1 unnamed protein product [Rotaria magnacalcarata]